MTNRSTFMLGLLVGAASMVIAKYVLDRVDAPFPCDHKTVKEFPSPNGKSIAELVVINCGATTRYASVVKVRNIDAPQEGLDYFFAVDGLNDMDVVWDDNYSFTIAYNAAEIYRQVIIWRGATIKYRERP
jgi:hypothetical protein